VVRYDKSFQEMATGQNTPVVHWHELRGDLSIWNP